MKKTNDKKFKSLIIIAILFLFLGVGSYTGFLPLASLLFGDEYDDSFGGISNINETNINVKQFDYNFNETVKVYSYNATVTNNEGTLPYYIDEDGTGDLWILLTANSNDFEKFYIEPKSGSETANPDAIFEFYDTFNDLSQFTTVAGDVSLSDGKLVLTGTDGTRGNIESIQTFSYPTILETNGYASGLTSSAHICSFLKSGDGNYRSGDFYLNPDNVNHITYTTMNGGTENQFVDIVISDYTNTHTYKVIWDGSSSTGYQDGNQVITTTNEIPTVDQIIQFREGTSGTYYTNWVRVSQYLSSVPTYSNEDYSDRNYIKIDNEMDSPISDYQVRIPASEFQTGLTVGDSVIVKRYSMLQISDIDSSDYSRGESKSVIGGNSYTWVKTPNRLTKALRTVYSQGSNQQVITADYDLDVELNWAKEVTDITQVNENNQMNRTFEITPIEPIINGQVSTTFEIGDDYTVNESTLYATLDDVEIEDVTIDGSKATMNVTNLDTTTHTATFLMNYTAPAPTTPSSGGGSTTVVPTTIEEETEIEETTQDTNEIVEISDQYDKEDLIQIFNDKTLGAMFIFIFCLFGIVIYMQMRKK